MNKKRKTVVLIVTICFAIGFVSYLIIDYFRSQGSERICEPGTRTIDIRDFITNYSGYSYQLELKINDKSLVTAKIEPMQIQQLSDVMQRTIEFRKFIVESYNSCAMTKDQFIFYGIRFHNLDALAENINNILKKQELSFDDHTNLTKMVDQYITLSHQISMK